MDGRGAFQALDLGGPRLYWLDGGGFRIDGGAVFGAVPRPRWSALYPPADDNTVPLTAHVVLVADGSSWGLIDAGFGHHLSERQRRFYAIERDSDLERSLAEVGVSRTQLDWIALTHLHLDHAGGILSAGEPTFPNAAVWVQTLEAHEARDATNRAHGSYAGPAFDALASRGLVREVEGAADITPNVGVFLTGGHTRGHQGVLVSGADGAALLHLGDLIIAHPQVNPLWVSAMDDYPLDSVRVKREWLGRAAASGWWVSFSHDVAYTAGRLDADGRLAEGRPARH